MTKFTWFRVITQTTLRVICSVTWLSSWRWQLLQAASYAVCTEQQLLRAFWREFLLCSGTGKPCRNAVLGAFKYLSIDRLSQCKQPQSAPSFYSFSSLLYSSLLLLLLILLWNWNEDTSVWREDFRSEHLNPMMTTTHGVKPWLPHHPFLLFLTRGCYIQPRVFHCLLQLAFTSLVV